MCHFNTYPFKIAFQVYDNPIEGKLANDNVVAQAKHDAIFGSMWEVLQSPDMIELVKQITSIHNLENDPYLHGAGLHYHPVFFLPKHIELNILSIFDDEMYLSNLIICCS